MWKLRYVGGVLISSALAGCLIVFAGCGAQSDKMVESSEEPDDDIRYSRMEFPDESTTDEGPGAPDTAVAPFPVPDDAWPKAAPYEHLPGPIDPIDPAGPMTEPIETMIEPPPRATRMPPRNPIRMPESAVGETSLHSIESPRINPIRVAPLTAAAPRLDRNPVEMPDVDPTMGDPEVLMYAPAPMPPDEMFPMARESDPEPAMATMEAASREPAMAAMEAASRESATAAMEAASRESMEVVEEVAENDAPQAETEKESKDPYKLVTVFYGTDRLADNDASRSKSISESGLFKATAVCAGITLLFLLVSLFLLKGRTMAALTGLALVATFAMAAFTVLGFVKGEFGLAGPSISYGDERGSLEMGTCQVSIPKDHEVGQVERPSIIKLEVFEDPTRHVVLLEVNREKEDKFFSGLQSRIDQSQRKEAFVFIHGFNVTFDAAARRTAQLAHDLKFDGAPIFYSWPSQGGFLEYTVDETNAVWTVPHLKEFITGVAQRSGAQSIHLIAHSMGNRALTSALQSLAYDLEGEEPMFSEVLLTAPDIDADVFRRDIAPAILGTADRITLYASSNDEALAMSKTVHGYPRAGDSGPGLVVVPGIDTIDVSSVDTSLIGHSYYGSNGSVISDMIDLLQDAKPPGERRWLKQMQIGQFLYWIFSPDGMQLGSIPDPAIR